MESEWKNMFHFLHTKQERREMPGMEYFPLFLSFSSSPPTLLHPIRITGISSPLSVFMETEAGEILISISSRKEKVLLSSANGLGGYWCIGLSECAGALVPVSLPVVGIMSLGVFTRMRNARDDGDGFLHTFAFGTFLLHHFSPKTKSTNCHTQRTLASSSLLLAGWPCPSRPGPSLLTFSQLVIPHARDLIAS